MNWIKALTSTLVVTGVIALSSCGENPDTAYDRGYEDGAK